MVIAEGEFYCRWPLGEGPVVEHDGRVNVGHPVQAIRPAPVHQQAEEVDAGEKPAAGDESALHPQERQ